LAAVVLAPLNVGDLEGRR